ncbi:signal peptidase II [Ancylobacter sp. 6x-1]|uniref:Lipoprotein signal peptidase n=1 Tax=Ancylobacter crimeensis TaxID=2579147 RepID=A0ABT0DGE0_9HYPH|nr:signal peptidase II [Ancylobacter crimeensis]MCK0199033.1 signal peptidase II [Ancylobacter crimeensis]
MRLRLFGPLSWFGLLVALAVLVADQATKIGVMRFVDFGPDGLVPVMPFMDLVVTWNTGISYGLFAQGADGWWVLGLFKLVAAIAFTFWLARVTRRVEALALGLLIGGALGNAIDRAAYGAVFDFVSLHAFGFHWYIFNIADVAIVAGVGVLLYDSFFGRAAKSPPSGGR